MNINDYYHLYLGQRFKVEKVMCPENLRHFFCKDGDIIIFDTTSLISVYQGVLIGKLILTPIPQTPDDVNIYMKEKLEKAKNDPDHTTLSITFALSDAFRYQISRGIDLFGLINNNDALNSMDI